MPDIAESSLSLSLRLVKALDLARHGAMKEAEATLAPPGAIPDSSVALQALAALATSQGDYTRALRLWRLLQQREPNHAEAHRMIEAIELWQDRPAWFRFLPLVAGLIAAALLTGLLIWALSDDTPPPRPRPPIAAPVISPAPTAPTRSEVPAVTMPDPARRRRTR